MVIIKEASDEELEDIIRKAENTHSAGSQFQKANIELDIRRKRKLFELQEKMLRTLQMQLKRIVALLEYINKKPLKAALVAGTIAIIIGVLISFLSELISYLLKGLLLSY